MIKGNKGEWSEFYTFLKVLDDKKLFFADKNLDFIENQTYPVRGIIREEAKTTSKYYFLDSEGNIQISQLDGEFLGFVELSELKSCIREMLKTLSQKGLGSSFPVPCAEEMMPKLFCTQIKAGNQNKADITVKVQETGSPMENDLGFSVKSMLGGAATLVNSSGATNFIYKINGFTGDIEGINAITTRSKIRDRIKAIQEGGGEIIFDSLANNNFKNNLAFIDFAFIEVLATGLKKYFEGKVSKIADLPLLLDNDIELKNKYNFSIPQLESKLKMFLRISALGMVPNTLWDGESRATGGCLVVKQNGDVACYRVYDFDALQEYLYRNTKFETPGSGKHGFGKIYEKDGDLYINLNLQIRFLK